METAVLLERGDQARATSRKRLVVASSMSIYGEGAYREPSMEATRPGLRGEDQLRAREWEVRSPSAAHVARAPTRETKPLIPTSVYAITKRDHEELCLVTGAAYGIPTVALRYFNVYGPARRFPTLYTGVAAIFASRLLNGRPPVIFEDGRQSRDFIHVSDIVEGFVRALESERAVGTAVNLGTGRPSTVDDIARLLADGLGVQVEPERTARYRAGDIRHCYADTARAEERLGFKAQVRLEDGIGELVGWLAGQEAEDRIDVATSELASRGLTL